MVWIYYQNHEGKEEQKIETIVIILHYEHDLARKQSYKLIRVNFKKINILYKKIQK